MEKYQKVIVQLVISFFPKNPFLKSDFQNSNFEILSFCILSIENLMTFDLKSAWVYAHIFGVLDSQDERWT